MTFGPKRQGGSGGSGFVNLTGLFPTKKGNGMVGSLKPEEFKALSDVMEEAYEAGRELVFLISEPRSENAKVAATLAVAVSQRDPYQPKEQEKPRFGGFGKKPGAPTSNAGSKPYRGKTEKQNPPADDLEKFLREVEDQ